MVYSEEKRSNQAMKFIKSIFLAEFQYIEVCVHYVIFNCEITWLLKKKENDAQVGIAHINERKKNTFFVW